MASMPIQKIFRKSVRLFAGWNRRREAMPFGCPSTFIPVRDLA